MMLRKHIVKGMELDQSKEPKMTKVACVIWVQRQGTAEKRKEAKGGVNNTHLGVRFHDSSTPRAMRFLCHQPEEIGWILRH
jgi:hypothetical protein